MRSTTIGSKGLGSSERVLHPFKYNCRWNLAGWPTAWFHQMRSVSQYIILIFMTSQILSSKFYSDFEKTAHQEIISSSTLCLIDLQQMTTHAIYCYQLKASCPLVLCFFSIYLLLSRLSMWGSIAHYFSLSINKCFCSLCNFLIWSGQ